VYAEEAPFTSTGWTGALCPDGKVTRSRCRIWARKLDPCESMIEWSAARVIGHNDLAMLALAIESEVTQYPITHASEEAACHRLKRFTGEPSPKFHVGRGIFLLTTG
jgi:hypothetical protein